MRIAKEGKIFVYPVLFLTIVLIIFYYLYNISGIIPAISGFLFLFCLNFFRDPNRLMPDGEKIIIAPSDGKIIRIEKLHDEEIGESFVVSIFLNIFDVHANWMPLDGDFLEFVIDTRVFHRNFQ